MTVVSIPRRDEAWFEDLYRALHPRVHAYVRRRCPDVADDVTAEVFMVAWRRADDVPDEALPWLYRVAANTLGTHRRTTARRLRLVDRLRSVPEQGPGDPGDRVAAEVDAQRVAADVLAQLRPDDAEILRLWAWEELDAAGMATVLGVKPHTATVRLSRARQRARDVVERANVRGASAAQATERGSA